MRIHFKSYGELGRDISSNMNRLAGDWDLIVGIPRSGMVPAYMIALALNVHCTDISAWINNYPLRSGITRRLRKNLDMPWEAEKVLVVDDSIMTGKSLEGEMGKVPSWLRERASTLAVYTNRPIRNDVDIVLEFIPNPRVFEWNIFHHDVMGRACIALEGVIADKNDAAADGGPTFRHMPTGVINTIISCKAESRRNEVEAWLEGGGIDYENLVMNEEQDGEAMLNVSALVRYKAKAFVESSAEIFIEEDRVQARMICRDTNMPVYCVSNSRIYNARPRVGLREIKNMAKFLLWRIGKRKARCSR